MDDAMGRYIPGQIKKPGALKQEAFMGVVCLETRVLVSSCLEGGGGHEALHKQAVSVSHLMSQEAVVPSHKKQHLFLCQTTRVLVSPRYCSHVRLTQKQPT